MKEVPSNTAEAKLGTFFHTCKEACPLQTALIKMGHLQLPTPIATDSIMVIGLANNTLKQKQSKAIDMQFYWLRDYIWQGLFTIYWCKGSLNKADYFTNIIWPNIIAKFALSTYTNLKHQITMSDCRKIPNLTSAERGCAEIWEPR